MDFHPATYRRSQHDGHAYSYIQVDDLNPVHSSHEWRWHTMLLFIAKI
jgi:hypothetical protein